MKLVDWARKQGISYRTALRWFQAGKIPDARQLPTGRIIVDLGADECGGACVAEIHMKCLVEKLSADDVKALAGKLRDEGYIVKHRDDA